MELEQKEQIEAAAEEMPEVSEEEIVSGLEEEAEAEETESAKEEAKEEEAEEKEAPEAQEEPAPASYTDEEIGSLDPFEVDPERLPSAAQAVHKRYMQMYRESVLPELEQLRAFRQRAEEIARANDARRDPRQEFANEVKTRAARSLGVQEIDELNPEHLIELSRQSVMLQNEMYAQDSAERGRQDMARRMDALKASLREEIPNFEALDRFAKADLENLPYSKAQRVIGDLRSGDPQRIRAVYKMFGERYAASKKKPASPVQAPPAKVIHASSGVSMPKSVDYDGFAGASADEQARMIMDMGLVEEEI